jgi:hypothetical protein
MRKRHNTSLPKHSFHGYVQNWTLARDVYRQLFSGEVHRKRAGEESAEERGPEDLHATIAARAKSIGHEVTLPYQLLETIRNSLTHPNSEILTCSTTVSAAHDSAQTGGRRNFTGFMLCHILSASCSIRYTSKHEQARAKVPALCLSTCGC